jgi:hypothetical protein
MAVEVATGGGPSTVAANPAQVQVVHRCPPARMGDDGRAKKTSMRAKTSNSDPICCEAAMVDVRCAGTWPIGRSAVAAAGPWRC